LAKVKLREWWRYAVSRLLAGAIQSVALTLRIFVIRLVSIMAASLRFPSEFATVMVIDRSIDWRSAHHFESHPLLAPSLLLDLMDEQCVPKC